jgi:hypothetical protein
MTSLETRRRLIDTDVCNAGRMGKQSRVSVA